MKLGTIRHDQKPVAVVALGEEEVVPLQSLVPGLASLEQLIEGGAEALGTVLAALATGAGQSSNRLPTRDVEWSPPLPRPRNIFCVALNNRAMDDLAMHLARHPVYFNKPASSLIGSGQTIEVLPHYGVTHCEPELGVVIGKGGRHISLEAAPDHVFGYTIVNDITSASMRHEDHFHFNFPRPIPGSSGFEIKEEHTSYPARYKGADTFGPTGPWIVTKDEIPNPAGLAVRCWLDDEIIADDNTRNLRFSIAQVIYWISAHATLMPGDIISMGTAFHPDSKMKPLTYGDLNRRGDVLRVDIEGLGSLVNPVKRISRPDPRAEFGG